MDNFLNPVLQIEDLPEFQKESFLPLEKRFRIVLLLRASIVYLIVAGVFLAIYFSSDNQPPLAVLLIGITVWLLSLLFSIGITMLGFKRRGYLVRDYDFSYQRGYLTYKLISVPYNRIQHVEVNQGVIPKLFNLASVKVYTAGGATSDLSVPGLPKEVAESIKSFISEKISQYEH